MPAPLPSLDAPPYRLSGTVVAALLNDAAQLAALGEAVNQAPYRAPPRSPVLALRPRHTLAGDGDAIAVPAEAPGLIAGASLGIVIGRVACRVAAAAALGHVCAYLIAGDYAVPHDSHYRPALRFNARDGFCPLGSRVVAASAVAEPDALAVEVLIDGAVAQRSSTAGRIRGVARLIADVTEFMTLQAGDLLLLGAAHGAPLVRAGQSVTMRIAGLGALHNRVVAEAPSGAGRA